MCPFCIGTAALMAGKLMSVGGLTAFLGKKLAVETGAKVRIEKQDRRREQWKPKQQ